MMSESNLVPDIGSPEAPLRIGRSFYFYHRQGKWHFRSPETQSRFAKSFIEADESKHRELILEMMHHSYHLIYPLHDCVEHPNLPCSACEKAGLKALQIKSSLKSKGRRRTQKVRGGYERRRDTQSKDYVYALPTVYQRYPPTIGESGVSLL